MPPRPPAHKPQRANAPRKRPSASRRGYDEDWKRARAAYLMKHPLCVAMLRDGRACGRPAKHVDHKQALNAGGDKYDEANLQSLCHGCHSRKSCVYDGSFGRPKRKA